MTQLILASTSTYRAAVLQRLGIPFDAVAPDCDEDRYPDLGPDDLARILAIEKAASRAQPGALVIGSDQVVDLDGEVLGKPHTVEKAQRQLERMQGRTHRLVTAVAVASADRTEVAIDVHTMTMRALTPEVIARYIAYDRPLDCAGSYKLESRGIALFERIEADPETHDDTAIQGLPLMKTLRLLRGFGFDVL